MLKCILSTAFQIQGKTGNVNNFISRAVSSNCTGKFDVRQIQKKLKTKMHSTLISVLYHIFSINLHIYLWSSWDDDLIIIALNHCFFFSAFKKKKKKLGVCFGFSDYGDALEQLVL